MKTYLIVLIIVVVSILLIAGYTLLYNRLQKLRIKVDEGYSDINVALEKRFDLLSEQIEAVKKYLSHEYKTLTDVTAIRSGTDHKEKVTQQQEGLTKEAVKTIDEQISNCTKNMQNIGNQLKQGSGNKGGTRRSATERKAQERAAKQMQLEQNANELNDNINKKVSVLADAHQNLSSIGTKIHALTEQYPVLNSWVSMDRFQLSIIDSEEHLQASRRLYNANVSLYNQQIVSIPWSIVAAIAGMKKAEFYNIEEKKRSFSVNFE